MPDDSESKLVVTRDGSHTVYSAQFDQHYHNPNGAVAESRHVFFEQTDLLDALANDEPITILEVGFGTGLNLLLFMDYYRGTNSRSQVHYYSIEGFPLDLETANNLNYGEHLDHPEQIAVVKNLFGELSDGMNHVEISDNMSLHLFHGMFEDFPVKNIGAQYIFHDAFSPDVNPKLWTGDVFNTIASISAPDVILSTYCAASKVQGTLAWAGWKVAKTQGALGKREMILAALNAERLENHKRVNEEHYANRYEEGDFD